MMTDLDDEHLDAAEFERLRAAVADLTDARAAGDPADLLAALTRLRQLRDRLSSWEPLLVAAARDRGVSWARLAPALGVASRQAAERRYLRLRESPGGEATGEARVQAERDRRAGDRAVADWARQNAGLLRELAGQVSALAGLNESGSRRVAAVRRALAGDDPADLLAPLGAAHEHLPADQGSLAHRIGTMEAETERVRRRVRSRRRRSTTQ